MDATLGRNRIGLEERCAIQEEPRSYASVTPPNSFVTRYVDYARQRTDAPPEAHELMAIGLLSALAGPTARLPIATSVKGWSLCIWVLYIVNSTTGRKTTVISTALDIAQEVLGEDAIFSWEGSPQGFIQRLQSRDGQSVIFARDEYSGLLQQMNRASGHMAGLAQMFIRAYDGGSLENVRTKKKNKQTGESEDDTDRVLEPYLVKLCASTFDSFVTRATIDNVLDGFLARFVMFTGFAEPQPVKRSSPQLIEQRLSLIDHARLFHEKARAFRTPIYIEDDVFTLQWDLERELDRTAQQCSRPDAAGPALKRLSESVLKVAGLLAIDEAAYERIPRISAIHFDFARRMGMPWIDSTLALIEALGRTGFERNCNLVLSTVRAHPNGIRFRDLYRRHRKLKPRDVREVLDALEIQGEITVADAESGRGRAFNLVAPVGGQS